MSTVQIQKEQKAELHTKLWEMANELRGNMEAYEFKNYILGLIFYRYLSERVENFVNKLLANDNITYEQAWEREDYREGLSEDCLDALGYVIEPKYLFSHVIKMIERNEFGIDYLEKVISSITESTIGQESEQDFDGLWEDMDLKSSKLGKMVSEKSKLIATILNTISTIDFHLENMELDVLGDAYEYLIGMFAQTAGKKGGEFYTPVNMSKLVARLATVGLTEAKSVSDCACGSGGLLLQVGKYCKVGQYFGQELTSTTYNLARMNMLLHGIDYKKFEILNVDTLENHQNEEKQFTVQVANPPYSTSWSANAKFLDDDRFSVYGKLAPKGTADFAFVQHMIYHMADDGRIAVLLPHGVLFRGNAEETIRKHIVKDMNYLDAVIGLPANCFQGTSIPVCCLILKRERNGNSNNICFIDASKYFTQGKNQNSISDEDIERIVCAYAERKEIDKFCHIATMEEIEENDYNLNIPRYVDTFEPEPEVDLQAVKTSMKQHEEKIKTLEAELKVFLDELGV